MKKIIALLFLPLLFLIVGCGGESKQELRTLKFGLMPDVDAVPFVIAQEKGYFAEEGLTVELQPFKSAIDRDSALQSGNLDGAVSDMLAVAFAKDGGFDVKITSRTDGSYKLIAAPKMEKLTVAALANKEVAVSRNTIIEYVTDHILESHAMSGDDVAKVVIPQIPTRLELLQNGKLAAATLPEPLASVAIHNGCHFIEGSDEIGINPGVILFTQKSTKEKQKEIKALYRAYNKAVKYLNSTDRSEYIDLVVEKSGFPPAAKEALVFPTYKEAELPRESDVKDCVAWLKNKDLIKQSYSYADLVIDLLQP